MLPSPTRSELIASADRHALPLLQEEAAAAAADEADEEEAAPAEEPAAAEEAPAPAEEPAAAEPMEEDAPAAPTGRCSALSKLLWGCLWSRCVCSGSSPAAVCC